jgi:calcineurin-like phosphoesterase
VATADEQILPNGTGYITDLGMTGPVDGILGVCAEDVVYRSRTHLPRRFTVASGEVRAHGALFEVDPVTGKTKSVKRVAF